MTKIVVIWSEFKTQNLKCVLIVPLLLRFVPCLKYIIQNATTTELRLLRGKTIECISLIGLAVGPEKFTADASEVMEMLLKTQTGDAEMSDDDPQVRT